MPAMLWVMLAMSSGWCWISPPTWRAEDRPSAALERSHVGSVERLPHGRGVGRHEDEPDVGMRLHMEGQELLTDVHGTHVHEADPWGLLPSGFRCLVARNKVMLRRVSMTTCCSPPASHPRSSRGNILQHVSLLLMMRLRSVMDASFNVHSIFCWHSSPSVRVVASAHSFPSSPMGFLKEYPIDRMNFRDWRVEKRQAMPSDSKCAFRSSARLLRHSTLCCRRGTRCLPRPGVPGSAGGQERYQKSSARSTCGWCRCVRARRKLECPFCGAGALRHGSSRA